MAYAQIIIAIVVVWCLVYTVVEPEAEPTKRTGMEPLFELLTKVRYAIRMFRIERENWKAYRRNV